MSNITEIKALAQASLGASVVRTTDAGGSSGAAAVGSTLPQQVQKAAKPGQATVDQAVLQVNNYLQAQQRTLEFSVDKTSGRPIIKVVDQATGKVLRQIPPEYMIRLAQTLQQNGGMTSTGVKIKT